MGLFEGKTFVISTLVIPVAKILIALIFPDDRIPIVNILKELPGLSNIPNYLCVHNYVTSYAFSTSRLD